jgi:hypothetical protein
VEHLRLEGSWREGKEMELVEGRNQSKREGEEIDFVANIDQFSYISAQQNPQGVLELPFSLVSTSMPLQSCANS